MTKGYRSHPSISEGGCGGCHSVAPSGDEELVGQNELTSHGRNGAYMCSLGVVPGALRKPGTLPSEMAKVKSALRRLKSQSAPVIDDVRRHGVTAESYRRLLDISLQENPLKLRSRALRLMADPMSKTVEFPLGIKFRSYRLIGLGHLLMAIQEEVAEKAGLDYIQGDFDVDTSGTFVLKHGWNPIGNDSLFITARKTFRN